MVHVPWLALVMLNAPLHQSLVLSFLLLVKNFETILF